MARERPREALPGTCARSSRASAVDPLRPLRLLSRRLPGAMPEPGADVSAQARAAEREACAIVAEIVSMRFIAGSSAG